MILSHYRTSRQSQYHCLALGTAILFLDVSSGNLTAWSIFSLLREQCISKSSICALNGLRENLELPWSLFSIIPDEANENA